MKKVFLKFALVIIGIILACLVTEAYLRFFKPQAVHSSLPKDMDCYRPDNTLFVTLKPNSICSIKATQSEFDIKGRVNNLGFRGSPLDFKKNEAVERIAFIGDSYVFGFGVDDNDVFHKVLQNQLLSEGIKTEIINAGIPGVGLDYYYLVLKEKILPLKPDIVVVGIYLGNDFNDFRYYAWAETDEKELPTKISSNLEYVDTDGSRRLKTTPLRYKLPILQNSHFFIFLTNTLFGEIGELNEIKLHSSGTNCLVKNNCHEIDAEIEKFKKTVLGIKSLAQENKFNLEIVLIPWEAQLPRNLTRRSNYSVFVPNQNRYIINDMLDQFFEENSINYIDLLYSFEQYQGPDQVFYPNDKHWTKVGHQIAAEALLPDIINLLELPN